MFDINSVIVEGSASCPSVSTTPDGVRVISFMLTSRPNIAGICSEAFSTHICIAAVGSAGDAIDKATVRHRVRVVGRLIPGDSFPFDIAYRDTLILFADSIERRPTEGEL